MTPIKGHQQGKDERTVSWGFLNTELVLET